MRRAWLVVLLAAAPAAAWDSRCYLGTPVPDPGVPGGVRAECTEGPETARNRWLGPSDEHRALLEFGRIFGGLPHAVSDGASLTVFTGDGMVDVAGQPMESYQPVDFVAAKRVQTRVISVPELAQLPDHAYALWDWATGNETCPLDASVPAQACHEFKTHMGPVNSNHFVPQSAFFYEYYHRLALGRAADCSRMLARLGSARSRFAEFPVACEREALMLEAIGQHFLQDAWAAGHMWERWGSPDLADFPTPTDALLVSMVSGLIHGARALLETVPDLVGDFVAAQLVGAHFDDPLNAPGPPVGFRGPADTVPHAGLGDLYLTDLIAMGGAGFPETYTRLFSCSAAGLREVYTAAGAPEDPLMPLAPGLDVVDPTSDACFGQRVTNAAMRAGLALDFALPDGTKVHFELDSTAATHLVPTLSVQAGGTPTAAQTTQFQVDVAHIVNVTRVLAAQDPDGVALASGVLPPLLGVQANGHYVKTPPAAYVDPPLPWPTGGAPGEEATRALALARTFHRAHAIDWCNRFHAGSAEGLDVDALRARAESLHSSGAPPAVRDAACAACGDFAARHLRVGHDVGDYDTAREPLCHFLADDPAGTQYVFQPGDPGDAIPALAKTYCGCASTTTTTTSTTSTTLACGYAPGTTPEGSYTRTCTGCTVTGPTLACDCLNFSHLPVHTTIDVTGCRTDPRDPMVNVNGVLTCKRCGARGACCLPGASCADTTTFEDCQAGGDFQGEGTTCAASDCASPRGACCRTDDSCRDFTSPVSCNVIGSFQGQSSTCSALDCAARGACCKPAGACDEDTSFVCASEGTFQGVGTTCGDVDCSPHGACCLPDGSCTNDTSASVCGGVGVFQGEGSTCDAVVCPAP
jgi:hypothetical protein